MSMDDLNQTGQILLANKWGAVTEQKGVGDNFASTSIFQAIKLTMKDGAVTEPYRQHVWTYACVTAIATAFKQVPFVVVKEDKAQTAKRSASDPKFRIKMELQKIRNIPMEKRYTMDLDAMERRGFEVVETGPLYDLFANVNPVMSRSQLWEAWNIHMLLDGAVAWILEGKDAMVEENEWPTEIWTVPKERLEPVFKNGVLESWILKNTTGDRSKDKPVRMHQIIYFYRYSPYGSSVQGLAPAETVEMSASQDLKAGRFNEALFDNGGEPGGIVMLDKFVGPEKQNQILRKWNDRHQGEEKAGRTALLQNGAKYDRTPVNYADMQFLEGRKWNRDETFAAYGVPKMMGAIYEDLQLSTAQIAERTFWQNTIIPQMHYIEDVLNKRLMDNPNITESNGHYVMFDLSAVEALREDLVKKSEVLERFVKSGATFNDANTRLELGFDKYTWGDTWYKSFSLTSVEESDASDVVDNNDKPDATKSTPGIFAPAFNTIERIRTKHEQRELRALIEKNIYTPVVAPFTKKLKTYWYEMRKVQLELWDNATKMITRADIPVDELDDVLFNNKEWQAKLVKMSQPYRQEGAVLSLDEVADELDLTVVWGIEDPRIAPIMAEKANKIRGVTDRAWNELKATMIDGIQQLETVTELTTRIKSFFNTISEPSRRLTIARTETAQVVSAVRNENFVGEGVKNFDWSSSNDDSVREDHKIFDQAGKKNKGHNWMQDVGKSGVLRYPSDMSGPVDQIINCRCVQLAAL